MGCGKTTVGKRLAKKLSLQFLDLDNYLEEKFGKTVSEQFSEVGENAFRERERDAIREIPDKFPDVLVSTGGGAPCFFDNMDTMRANGVTVYLKMNAAALASRLKSARRERPLLANKTPDELEKYISELLSHREPFYEQSKIVVSALSVDVNGLVDRIYRNLK